jgi:phage shock protein PspC (stress-responsive transcriptional regulator)
MNKVFNINLGGIPFTIDEDAYLHLNNYLETIHNHFRQSEGYEEITNDIEARMAELFQEKLGNKPIVVLQDVKHVIAIMGTPEDFGADPIEADTSSRDTGRKWKFKTGKRLFRNSEDEVIGGVCSGIAAYIGVQDPIWIRLFFGILAISGGFAIPVYIILWIALPKAESASDRLAMRGEPANVSNIGKIIQEEFEHVSEKVNAFGDELNAKFGNKKKSTTSQGEGADEAFSSQQFRRTAAEGFNLLGAVIRTFIEALQKIIKPIAFVIGIALVAMLAILWIVLVGGLFFGLPFSSFIFTEGTAMTVLWVVNLLVLLGVPIVTMIMFVMRLFMRTSFRPRWAAGLWIFWSINLISFFFFSSMTFRQFSTSSTINLGTDTSLPDVDTLFIELGEDKYKDVFLSLGDELKISGNTLISSNIVLDIEKSKNGAFELVKQQVARGETSDKAQKIAYEFKYNYQLEGKRLILPKYFTIPKGKIWRAQKVHLTLRVPEGKFVKVQESSGMYRVIGRIEQDEKFKFPAWDFSYTWRMGPNGMICPEYASTVDSEISLDNFDKIRMEGNIRLKLRQGDEQHVVFAEGSEYRKEVEIFESNGLLNIVSSIDAANSATLEITLPDLSELEIIKSGDVEVRGFNVNELSIVYHSNGTFSGYIDAENLKLDVKGKGKCEIRGKGVNMTAKVDDNSELDAEYFTIENGDIELKNASKAKVSVIQNLKQRIDSGCELIKVREPNTVTNH